MHLTSINKRYAVCRGRIILTEDYKIFKRTLQNACQPTGLDGGPYSITINLETYMDIDNPIKCILDALQYEGIIIDDKYVHELHVTKKPILKGVPGKIEVFIDYLK